MDAFVGEIRPFVFLNLDASAMTPPAGWLLCNGQQLPVPTGGDDTYLPLFSQIGFTFGYGGTSATTFAVPNLAGTACMGFAGGPWRIGTVTGEALVTLAPEHVPPHSHPLNANVAPGMALTGTPVANRSMLAQWYSGGAITPIFDSAPAATGTLATQALAPGYSADPEPHENRMPYLCMPYFICFDPNPFPTPAPTEQQTGSA